MRQTRELIDNAIVWIGNVENGQRQRNGTLNRKLTVVKKVLKRAKSHLRSDVFAHCNHTDANDGRHLMIGIFGKVLGAVMEHLLDLEDVAGASVSTGLQNDRRVLGNLVLYGLESLNHGIGLLHPAEEEQTKAEAQESRMRVVQLLVGCFHHPLDDGAAHCLVALADIDHTQSQTSKRHLEHTVGATLG